MVTNVSQVIIFNFYVLASSRTQADKLKHSVSQNIIHTGSEMKALCISEYNTHRLRQNQHVFLISMKHIYMFMRSLMMVIYFNRNLQLQNY